MALLDPAAYLPHLRAESERFRAALATCDPSDQVPSCPAWRAIDLAHHLTEVQSFWAWVVAHRPKNPTDDHGFASPTRAPDLAGQLAAFESESALLITALEDADPGDEAWTWSTDQSVRFILRRQALEALVHRIDAEQTAGSLTGIDARLAADGVVEVLDVIYGGRPEWGEGALLPHFIKVECTDTDTEVWVQLGHVDGTDPEGIERHEDTIAVVTDPGVEPDAVISGEASALLTRLWRRGDGSAIHLAGDLGMVDHFRRATHPPIN